MNKNIALIAARGGSKGIPRKNLYPFCGKPLLYWSITQALQSSKVNSVWVTSDSDEILEYSKSLGAKTIHRPEEISNDTATSESAWLHALLEIEKEVTPDLIVALQATSPLRKSEDIDSCIQQFYDQDLDSAVSGSKIGDFYLWEKNHDDEWDSLNYDYRNRKRRQDIKEQYVENGSMYLFKPDILKQYKNRLAGKIGLCKMEFWQSFEIDDQESLKLCEVLMKGYLST